ncbi:MAG: hypothetical protein JW812_00915 [Alphaproteobacteria bacterium]|nr:hypothetical protein [Alphaproteobacteria bacterium]MBN2780089.1 hypothetical protein [Alphaproteobacteria bacterium]
MKYIIVFFSLAILWPSLSCAQTILERQSLFFGTVAAPNFATNTLTIDPITGVQTLSGGGDGFISPTGGAGTHGAKYRVKGTTGITDVEMGGITGTHAGLSLQNCKMQVNGASSPPVGIVQDCDVGDGATYIPVSDKKNVVISIGADVVISPTATPGVKIWTYDIIINF